MVDTTQRHRRNIFLGLAALVIAALGLWALAAGTAQTTQNPAAPNQAAALGPRTVQAGSVEVRMTPETLDQTGALFRVEFNTHSGALDLDPATAAHLIVNGSEAAAGTWTGPGPGGHHRAGSLRFATPVPPGATVELRITGLPQDTTGTWTTP